MAALMGTNAVDSEVKKRADAIETHRDTIRPIQSYKHVFEATTAIGLRPSQEDRFLMIPKFLSEDCSFCGVFDGTVGDDASEYINKNIVGHLCQHLKVFSEDDDNFITQASKAPHTKGNSGSGNGNGDATAAAAAADGGGVSDEIAERLRDGIRQAFLSCDGAFLDEAAQRKLHYASSTGVAAFLWRNLLTVAHIGDSKACIARMVGNEIHPEWLTVDHKPNMPLELRRIEASGGSLAWLHGNKPYIRGGDFFKRQALGEHPKQLNYSRAFGGKDLKNFGLSAEPDISHFETTADDRLVLIASDGLWDVLNPRIACNIALNAHREGKSATQEIVAAAIREMPICGVRDNVTVLAIFLNCS